MKQLNLSDFENLPWRKYDSNGHKCIHCEEKANNVSFSLCSSHTDTYRRLKLIQQDSYVNRKLNELNLDLSQIEDIEFDDVNHYDAPDFVDAFISGASQNGTILNNDQLDFINDSLRDWVYECLIERLY